MGSRNPPQRREEGRGEEEHSTDLVRIKGLETVYSVFLQPFVVTNPLPPQPTGSPTPFPPPYPAPVGRSVRGSGPGTRKGERKPSPYPCLIRPDCTWTTRTNEGHTPSNSPDSDLTPPPDYPSGPTGTRDRDVGTRRGSGGGTTVNPSHFPSEHPGPGWTLDPSGETRRVDREVHDGRPDPSSTVPVGSGRSIRAGDQLSGLFIKQTNTPSDCPEDFYSVGRNSDSGSSSEPTPGLGSSQRYHYPPQSLGGIGEGDTARTAPGLRAIHRSPSPSPTVPPRVTEDDGGAVEGYPGSLSPGTPG